MLKASRALMSRSDPTLKECGKGNKWSRVLRMFVVSCRSLYIPHLGRLHSPHRIPLAETLNPAWVRGLNVPHFASDLRGTAFWNAHSLHSSDAVRACYLTAAVCVASLLHTFTHTKGNHSWNGQSDRRVLCFLHGNTTKAESTAWGQKISIRHRC